MCRKNVKLNENTKNTNTKEIHTFVESLDATFFVVSECFDGVDGSGLNMAFNR